MRIGSDINWPTALRPGDLVALVSPSSAPSAEWLAESTAVVKGWGFEVVVGAHAVDSWGFMAGRDDDRVGDLNDALRNPEVRAVITTRGGAGGARIADRIDLEAVRRDPKIVVGFSDITNVHLALWGRASIPGVHGCLAGANARESLRHLLTTEEPLIICRRESALSADVMVPGRARGRLIGGNLRELAGSVGCGLPDLEGAILLIEDLRHVGLGQVERNLTQLRRSGALDAIAGVAVGLFDDFRGYVDAGWNVVNVLQDRLCDLGVPVLGGLDIGHGGVGVDGQPDQWCVSLGAEAELDADAGTLTVEHCVRVL
jgi:muramoyltetrapeptide carboxypeptidase